MVQDARANYPFASGLLTASERTIEGRLERDDKVAGRPFFLCKEA